MRPASVGFQCPEEATSPPVRTVHDRPGLAAVARLAPVTAALIALNALVFVVLVASGSSFLGTGVSELQDQLVQLSTTVGYQHADGSVTALVGIAQGHWWRLLTAMFVHYGIIHIGSNMLVLFFIGVPLERRIGRLRFLATYLVAGLGGGVVTYLFASPLQASAGASGAIFGLLGAYAVLARRAGTGELGSIGGTIVLNLVITFSIPGISITDHLGGLAVGAVLGLVLVGGRSLPAGSAERARGLAVEAGGFVAVAVVLVALVVVRTHVLHDRYDAAPRPVAVTAPAAVGVVSAVGAPAARRPLPTG